MFEIILIRDIFHIQSKFLNANKINNNNNDGNNNNNNNNLNNAATKISPASMDCVVDGEVNGLPPRPCASNNFLISDNQLDQTLLGSNKELDTNSKNNNNKFDANNNKISGGKNINSSDEQLLFDAISIKYANQVIPEVGLCVGIHSVKNRQDFIIPSGQGRIHCKADVHLVIFRPYPTQVCAGRIHRIYKTGLTIHLPFFEFIFVPFKFLPPDSTYVPAKKIFVWPSSVGDMVIQSGLYVRFRVEKIKFSKPTHDLQEIFQNNLSTPNKNNTTNTNNNSNNPSNSNNQNNVTGSDGSSGGSSKASLDLDEYDRTDDPVVKAMLKLPMFIIAKLDDSGLGHPSVWAD